MRSGFDSVDYTPCMDCWRSMDWARAWWTSLPICLVVTVAAGVAAGDVGGAVAGVEHIGDGGFDGERLRARAWRSGAAPWRR